MFLEVFLSLCDHSSTVSNFLFFLHGQNLVYNLPAGCCHSQYISDGKKRQDTTKAVVVQVNKWFTLMDCIFAIWNDKWELIFLRNS